MVSSDCLDPSHPATKLPKGHFLNIKSDILGIRAVPFATLTKPEQVWTTPCNPPIDIWTERIKRLISTNASLGAGEEPLEVAPIVLNNAKKNAIPMSFVSATSKKRTSNKKHIRGKIVSRLKVAVNLIVSRGANVAEVDGKPKLVMDEEEAQKMSDKWVSPGWTYIFFPSLEIYRMPYHDMIPLLRNSLQRIYDLSQQFEKKWVASATKPRSVSHSHVKAFHHVGKAVARKPFQNRNPGQMGHRAYSTRINHTTQPGSAKGRFDTTPHKHDTLSKKIIRSRDQSQLSEYLPPGPSNKLHKASTNDTLRQGNSHVLKETIRLQFKSWASDCRRSNRFYEAPTLVPKLNRSILVPQTSGSSATTEPEATATFHPGDVVFENTLPISVSRDNPPEIIPANKDDDPSIIFLKELRSDAQPWLNQSSKRKREFIRRRIAATQAKQKESSELEFIGFDSRPNPSYDPFTSVESFGPQEGPIPTRKASLDLLETRSARISPCHPEFPLLEATDPALQTNFLSDYPRADPPPVSPDDLDPFAPLILMEGKQHGSTIHTESADRSPGGASDPPDLDPFAPLEPPPTSSAPKLKPKVDLTPSNVSSAKTPSIEDVVIEFDPFHTEDSDSCMNATTTTPGSPPTSGSSPTPSTSPTK